MAFRESAPEWREYHKVMKSVSTTPVGSIRKDDEEQMRRERFAGSLKGFYQQDDVINAGSDAAELVAYLEAHDGDRELIEALNAFIKANWEIQNQIHLAYHLMDGKFNPYDY